MSPLMRIFHPPPLMNQPALESSQQFPLQQPVPPSMSEEQLSTKKKLNTSAQKVKLYFLATLFFISMIHLNDVYN